MTIRLVCGFSKSLLGDGSTLVLSIREGRDDGLDIRNDLNDVKRGGISVERTNGADELGNIGSTFNGGDDLAVGGDGGDVSLDTTVVTGGLEIGQEVFDGQKLLEDIGVVVVQVLVDLESILSDVTDLLDTLEVEGSFEGGLLLGLAFGGNVLAGSENSLDISNQVKEVLALEVSSEGLETVDNLFTVDDATVEVVEVDLRNVQVSLDTADIEEGLDFFNEAESTNDDFVNGSLFLVDVDDVLDIFVDLLGGGEALENLGGV